MGRLVKSRLKWEGHLERMKEDRLPCKDGISKRGEREREGKEKERKTKRGEREREEDHV